MSLLECIADVTPALQSAVLGGCQPQCYVSKLHENQRTVLDYHSTASRRRAVLAVGCGLHRCRMQGSPVMDHSMHTFSFMALLSCHWSIAV